MASRWKPAKACHDFNNVFTLFTAVPVLFIMYTNKDNNLISERILCLKQHEQKINIPDRVNSSKREITKTVTHKVKLDRRAFYLRTFTLQYGRYRSTRLPLEVVPPSGMFQRKIDETSKGLTNLLSIADDIPIVLYDVGYRDNDRSLRQVMQIWIKET